MHGSSFKFGEIRKNPNIFYRNQKVRNNFVCTLVIDLFFISQKYICLYFKNKDRWKRKAIVRLNHTVNHIFLLK